MMMVQLVLPEKYRDTLLKALHNEMGHQGVERTSEVWIAQRYKFENQLFAQLAKNCGIAGSRTTPYHQEGNGQVERFNRTLLQMMKTLTEKEKANWKESLDKLIYAYN